MRARPGNHSIDSLFTFFLLLTFSLFTLMLAGMGSAIYRSGAASLDENYTSRTAVAFISEKVRQHDESGSIFLTSVGDIPALAFRDVVEGTPFLTYVYFYDGAMCELFIREDRTPKPALGSRIVKLSSLTVEELSAGDAGFTSVPAGNTSDGNVSDGNISDGNVSDGNISGENVSDGNISGENVSDGNISDRNVSDGNISDENVSDGNVSGGSASDKTASDKASGQSSPEMLSVTAVSQRGGELSLLIHISSS